MSRGIRANAGRVDEEEGSDSPGSSRCRINDGKNNKSDQYTADITNVRGRAIIREARLAARRAVNEGSKLQPRLRTIVNQAAASPCIVRNWKCPPFCARIQSSMGSVLRLIKPYVTTPTATPCKNNASGRGMMWMRDQEFAYASMQLPISIESMVHVVSSSQALRHITTSSHF